MHASVPYHLWFSAAVCVVCAVFVSSSAVLLRERQVVNQALDMQRNVLLATGLATDDEQLSREDVEARFAKIRQIVINLRTGEEASEIDTATFDQRIATADVSKSREAQPNNAGLRRIANHALVYELREANDKLDLVVLPVRGLGLWGMLYGFIALDADLKTIHGLTFYEHKETPGLGGEVDNPRWKALWSGRQAFDASAEPTIEVIKGLAGPARDDPHRVDGLAGATMTSRGVTNLLQFWLGSDGFGPYLDVLRRRMEI